MLPKLLALHQVAEHFGVHEFTARRWLQAGRFPPSGAPHFQSALHLK